MIGWHETTLAALCKSDGLIQTGPFGSQLHMSDYTDSGVPVIMPTNIGDGRVDSSAIMRTSDEKARSLSRHMVRPGDIVYSRRGDITKRALIRDGESGWLCGTGCLLVRPSNHVNPRWLSYWLAQPDTHRWLLNHAVGATMLNLNTGILSQVPVSLPPQEEQERIAGVLAAFDDLIEVNRLLSRDLLSLLFAKYEALAEGRPMTSFGNVAHLVRDQWKPGNEGPSRYLGLEHFATEGAGIAGVGDVASVQSVSLRFRPGDVLYGKLRPYFRKLARPGFAGLCSSEIWVLRARDEYPQSLVHALAHAASFSEAASAGSTGTRMPRADWKHISTLPVPDLPLSEVSAEVLAGLESLWSAACDLDDENDDLARQRDELLPLLMSGGVRVRDREAVAWS